VYHKQFDGAAAAKQKIDAMQKRIAALESQRGTSKVHCIRRAMYGVVLVSCTLVLTVVGLCVVFFS
jgi:hypothetical protein